MGRITMLVALALGAITGCSSPASLEIEPEVLVLEGAGATGKLEPVIFDEGGKRITEGYAFAWFGLDSKVAKVHQDGRVEAVSSGKIMVDVEVVGTEVRGIGHVEVKIPGSVVASHEKLVLVTGGSSVMVSAEVRSDRDTMLPGYLPDWKVDHPDLVSLEQMPRSEEPRTWARLTPLKPGTTYATATYKDLAIDIPILVVPGTPPAPDGPAAE
jgi:hypothetical protein